MHKKTLKARLSVLSDFIDADELIKTLNKKVEDKTTEKQVVVNVTSVDTTSISTFVVPKGIDFLFEK